MASVAQHYNEHLGPIYAWMVGDVEAALRQSTQELQSLNLRPGLSRLAVDLGAGFGLYALPLAALGFSVLAIDACMPLVHELRHRAAALPMRIIAGDLTDFRAHLDGPAAVILCMGDTLTHLPTRQAVVRLLQDVVAALSSDGVFIATFRDYVSRVLEGNSRFIQVRSDEQRSLTCFLEYAAETVTVYDLLHERGAQGWQLRVSSYPKLRLDPGWIGETLQILGCTVRQENTPYGMIRLVARRIGPEIMADGAGTGSGRSGE